jgi:hypothetical protein
VALEIERAIIRVAEADIEKAIKDHLAAQGDMDLESVRVLEEGVVARGRYEMGWMKVGVELVFVPRAEDQKLRFDLSSLRMIQGVGLPGMVRGLIMDMVAELLRDMAGVSVDGETIWVDPASATRDLGFEVSAAISGVSLLPGKLQISIG